MESTAACIIAQASDLHVAAPGTLATVQEDTARDVRAAVEWLNRLSPAPQLVLFTGDLTDHGGQREYEHLAELLQPLIAPFALLPGNHDNVDRMRAVFPVKERGLGARYAYTIEHLPCRVIMLDSVILGSHQGRLGDEQLGWLDSALAQEPDKPTVVAVHHPPFRTGIDWMDALGLQDQADFAEVIRRSPQVQRVVSGHLHRAITCQWAGTTALTAPSVTYQVSLDLALDAAGRIVREPPAILLHVLINGHLVTHHSYITRDPNPTAFKFPEE